MSETEETTKAFEYEADNGATAALFRESQTILGGYLPLSAIKKYCLYIIYSTLRQFTDAPPDSRTHVPFPVRVRFALGKLALLTEFQGQQVDVDGIREETKEWRRLLFDTVVRLDYVYCTARGLAVEEHGAVPRMAMPTAAVRRWDELREAIARESGTAT